MHRLMALELPGTLVFDYPTIASLTAYISDQMAAATSAAGGTSTAAAMTPMEPAAGRGIQDSKKSQGCVVVVDAFSGRFAEQSEGGIRGRDTSRVTPLQRWDVDGSAPHVSHRPGARFGRYTCSCHYVQPI